MATKGNVSLVINTKNITTVGPEEVCRLLDSELTSIFPDSSIQDTDSEDSPPRTENPGTQEARQPQELVLTLKGETEGIPTGLFIASCRDSQNTHRHTVVSIATWSVFSTTELQQEDEILMLNDRCVYGHNQSHVLEAFRDVMLTSRCQTSVLTLIVRRPNKGDYSSGTPDFLRIELTLRVNVMVETARVFASRQTSPMSGHKEVLFYPRVVGADSATVQVYLKLKYEDVYIGFNSRAQNKLTPTPKRQRKNVFDRTRFVGYDTKAKQTVFVVTLRLTQRPDYYLSAQGSEVILKRYNTEPKPYIDLEHPERFFIIRELGKRDMYESLTFRGLFVSYEDMALGLQPHSLKERPPVSIVFAEDYPLTTTKVTYRLLGFSIFHSIVGAVFGAVRPTTR